MGKKLKFFFFILFSFQLLIIGTSSVLAADSCVCNGRSTPLDQTACTSDTGKAAGCVWGSGSQGSGGSGGTVNLPNPLPGVTSVPLLIKNIISTALGIVGSLALIMFIYGGFVWMLAAGNEQAVQKGKNVLMWAAIGLVVIFASYSLVNFLIAAITKGG